MNKPIKTALASFGMSGQIFHAPFLVADKRFNLVKVLERSKNIAETKIRGIKTVQSFNDLVIDPEIELIVVNTPNQLHYPMCRDALRNGKHVIVEKPFTINVFEADELINISKSKGLVLAVFQSKRFETDFQTLHKLIRDNTLGNIKLFESNFYRWKPDLGQKLWKINPGPGSGILYDLGSHLIDQVLVLFGKPDRIFADLGSLREGARVNDYFELIFDYIIKKVVLKSFLLSPYNNIRFAVYGDKAAFIKYGADEQENMIIRGILPGTSEWNSIHKNQEGHLITIKGSFPLVPVKSDYSDFFDNVYRAIRKGDELLVKPEEAREVIRMIELVWKSYEQGKFIHIK